MGAIVACFEVRSSTAASSHASVQRLSPACFECKLVKVANAVTLLQWKSEKPDRYLLIAECQELLDLQRSSITYFVLLLFFPTWNDGNLHFRKEIKWDLEVDVCF